MMITQQSLELYCLSTSYDLHLEEVLSNIIEEMEVPEFIYIYIYMSFVNLLIQWLVNQP